MKMWALVDNRSSELIAVSSEPQTREDFEREVTGFIEDWPRVRYNFTIREATTPEVHRVRGEHEWLSDVVALRKRAMANPLDGAAALAAPDHEMVVKANREQTLTIGHWTMALTYAINVPPGKGIGPRLFHASFKPDHPARLFDPQAGVLLANILMTLGALPLPDPLGGGPSPAGVLHFEWCYEPEPDA